MQGCKQFEPRLFYQISLNDLVPQNHLVRRLTEALDFSWIRSATATLYSSTGRPSIDPEVVADADAVRQVTRFDTDYVERAQAACASSQGRSLLKKRQTCIEGLFGQAKSQHGLDRARLRGLAKMHIQGLLTAMVLNVKKLLQAVIRGSTSQPKESGLNRRA